MTMNIKQRIIALILAIAVAFCTGCSSDSVSRAQVCGDELKAMLHEVLEDQEAPGASIAIKFNDGSVFSYAAGYADINGQEPLTTDHYFRIGSTTKTFTATAILMLYQEGLLSLDSTVDSVLPGVMTDYGDRITIRMLLNHTSGLNDYVSSPCENSYFFYILVDDPTRIWEPRELVDLAVAEGLASEPGESFLYSNTNYILLGMIIEAVTGQDAEAFFQEAVFEPLNLTETMMPIESGFPGAYAHGYYERDSNGILYDFSIQSPTAVWAAGNFISKPGDLLTWVEALCEGSLLTEDARTQQVDAVEMEEGSGYGYGLGILLGEGDTGHNGSVLGYQTQMFSSNGAYIVVYTNCYYQTRDNVSKQIYDRIKEIIF